MGKSDVEHLTIKKTGFELSTHLETWAEAFLLAKRSENKSPRTVEYYRDELKYFVQYCDGRAITDISQLTPADIRLYLLALQERGRNPGGQAAAWRAVKAFLRWYEAEAEPDGWRNPIKRVEKPITPDEPLDPITSADVRALLKASAGEMLTDIRDRAIFLCLLDTGARAAEFLALDVDDVDLVSGAALIRQGKGRKSRTVYLGKSARKALRQYLKARQDATPALWATDDGNRLTYAGLRSMFSRRAKVARIEPPEAHSFRRAFALGMLRAGVNVYAIQELMGHADLQVLKRYLKQTPDDLHAAHQVGGPADRL